jgi:glycosyltransferase involved in cell wall biosynthesis
VEPVVIVSTFPPLHCGIARYAAQQAEYLRRQGRRVVTVGHPGSEADAVVELCGGRNPLRMAAAVRSMNLDPGACSLAIHWHDGHFFSGGFSERVPTALALGRALASFADSELICHETYPPQEVDGTARRALRAVYAALRRKALLRATRLAFHSQAERAKAEAALGGRIPDSKVVIRDHGAFLFRYRDVDRDTARADLGIPLDVTLFLCIGFLAEHKGFHLAVEAMAQIPDRSARLAIVGSVREPTPEALAYADRLRDLASRDSRVIFRDEFLTDEEYDTWNAAADVVVAPYQQAFSSSVVARAKLFDRPVIVTDVGGLGAQVGPGDCVVHSQDDLTAAMHRCMQAGRCASP